jgi:hypothetical protein
MRQTTLLWIIVAVALLTVGGTLVWSTLSSISLYRTFEITWEVTNQTAGINVDTDNLYLGQIPKIGSSQRSLYLKNLLSNPSRVDVSVVGGIRKHVQQRDWKFMLQPNETKTINVTAHSNPKLVGKNFTGTLIVIFREGEVGNEER